MQSICEQFTNKMDWFPRSLTCSINTVTFYDQFPVFLFTQVLKELLSSYGYILSCEHHQEEICDTDDIYIFGSNVAYWDVPQRGLLMQLD